MDNKNNEIIDFSNQPLGLMAQEGAQIEKKMGDEYRKNEAARNNAANQDNPFADVTFGKKEEKPPIIMTVMDPNMTPNEQQPFNNAPTTPVEQPTMPSTEPTPTPEPKPEEVTTPKPMSEDERKQQILNELVQSSGGTKGEVISNGQEEQPGSWGLIVFLLLIGLVVGAIFVFKSGKLDSFLNKEEEKETETVNTEQPTGDTQPVTPAEPDPVKNYKIKQTIYIAMNDTFNNTSIGTVDLESNAGKFITTVSYNGLTSHNIDEYCDYSAGYCYIQDFKDKNKWSKEKFEPENLGPEATLEFLKSLGEAKEVSPGNYTLDVTVEEMLKMVMSTEGFDKKVFNLKATITIEYTVKDGYLTRVKMNFSQAVKDVKQYIIALEMSDFNAAKESVTVPEDIINKAK